MWPFNLSDRLWIVDLVSRYLQPEDVKRMLDAGASLVALNTGLRTNGMRLLKAASNGLLTNKD